MNTTNAAHWLIDRNLDQANASGIALRSRGRGLSYGELMRSTWRAQNSLSQLGVRSGERVVLLSDDGFDMVSWILGCLRSGVVVTLAPTTFDGDQLGKIARETHASLLVVSAARRFLIDAAAHRSPYLYQAVVLDEAGPVAASRIGGPAVVSWSDFSDDSEAPVSATTHSSAALWLYTRDHLDTETRVEITHSDMRISVETYARLVREISSTDRVHGMAKLCQPAGIEWLFSLALGAGATAVLESGRAMSPRGVCELIAREGVTVFLADSATALRIADSEVESASLSTIRTTVLVEECEESTLVQHYRERFGHTTVGSAIT